MRYIVLIGVVHCRLLLVYYVVLCTGYSTKHRVAVNQQRMHLFLLQEYITAALLVATKYGQASNIYSGEEKKIHDDRAQCLDEFFILYRSKAIGICAAKAILSYESKRERKRP